MLSITSIAQIKRPSAGAVIGLITLLAASHTCPVRADCIDDAARYQQVHPYVLRAIAYEESQMRADVIHYNTNATTDYGVMGINSVHLPELSSFDIGANELLNPCINTYVGAWYLRRKMEKYGNTWQAVAAYHSETPAIGAAYVTRIQALLRSWGVLAPDVD
ncbi:BapC protein [Dyella sp. M7H15-1]|uniref:lytic transglycosylase domain-containing protein n=1 Tax=Dyella sp. M7H15-1 TaxID=2501295 RepID=UPI001005152F|nr:lytic transglycosylase domain-containing protein [Dyella sp. M7H15-1]QAU23786.1 BapC protein [Dyella sp. M7H15-1]